MNVRNTTGRPLSLNSSSISPGYWSPGPPAQIADGSTVTFKAQGTANTADGVGGSVTYLFGDNITTFTINFTVPWYYWGSGGLTLDGKGASNWSAEETDASYQNVVSFPVGADGPVVYFAIGKATQAQRAFDFAKAVGDRLAGAASEPPPRSMSIVDVAREPEWGEISGPQLIAIFQGKTAATAQDILAAEGVPPSDRVRFVSNRGLISSKTSFAAAVDFAEHGSDVLKDDPAVYNLAEQTIAALHTLGQGNPEPRLNKLVDELENAKGVMLAKRVRQPLLPKVWAIEGILGCVYMAPGAALAQAGSCARDTRVDPARDEAMAKWQLQYLQDKLKTALAA